MVLYWKQQTTRKGTALRCRDPFVGPDFFLRLDDSSWLEGAHVFTTFENRLKKRARMVTLHGPLEPLFEYFARSEYTLG
jgi:hypothetical protein